VKATDDDGMPGVDLASSDKIEGQDLKVMVQSAEDDSESGLSPVSPRETASETGFTEQDTASAVSGAEDVGDLSQVSDEDLTPTSRPVRSPSSRKRQMRKAKVIIADTADGAEMSAALGINIENWGKITDFYKIGKALGAGAFGIVSKAAVKATNAVRAVKTIELPSGTRDSKKRLEYLKQEIRISKMMDHPNIIKLFEVFEDTKNAYMVLEFCSDGDLSQHLENGPLVEFDAAVVMHQILRGVNYMHQQRVCHRDLKTDNMLLSVRREPPSRQSSQAVISKFANAIRISDFGLSCLLEEGHHLKRNCGTVSHKSPQVLACSYGLKCDEWSCGVMVYYMLSGEYPFPGGDEEAIEARIKAGKFSWCEEWLQRSSEAMSFARQLLAPDEQSRAAARNALQHPWFEQQLPKRTPAALDKAAISGLRNFRKLNKFKKASLTVIVCMLKEKNIKNCRELFLYLDTDGDGVITLQELREALEVSTFHSQNSEEDTQAIFCDRKAAQLLKLHKRSSFQADGEVPPFTYTEFLAATFDGSKYITDAVCHAAFNCFDKDGSGQLEKAELLDGRLLGHLTADEAEDIIQELDQNDDGELSVDEFFEMMREEARSP